MIQTKNTVKIRPFFYYLVLFPAQVGKLSRNNCSGQKIPEQFFFQALFPTKVGKADMTGQFAIADEAQTGMASDAVQTSERHLLPSGRLTVERTLSLCCHSVVYQARGSSVRWLKQEKTVGRAGERRRCFAPGIQAPCKGGAVIKDKNNLTPMPVPTAL